MASTPALYGPDGRPLIVLRDSAPTRSGLVNSLTGMGGDSDKGKAGDWVPTLGLSRQKLEIIYGESWAAEKFIDIPVDDMWIRGRRYESDDEAAIRTLEEAEQELHLVDRIADAMKLGRLTGTGMLVLMMGDNVTDTPLEPTQVREGDLTNILVIDRFDAAVDTRTTDPWDVNYGQPEAYRITPSHYSQEILVHHSRVIRFDGRQALRSDGWEAYDSTWGLSELVKAMTAISQDAALLNAIAHLVQEASVAVVKVQQFSEMIDGNNLGIDQPSLTERAVEVNRLRGIFRTMFMDANDEFDRKSIPFGGLPDLVDRLASRLAAIAGIPATRFLSRSPEGLNATGDSDTANYAIHVNSMQTRMLQPQIRPLDIVMARHVGLSEPLEYEWRSLTDLSETDQAAVTLSNIQSLHTVYADNSLTEEEYRKRAEQFELFGELGPMPEDLLARMAAEQEAEMLRLAGPPANAPPQNAE